MANFVQAVTLDGASDFTLGTTDFEWNSPGFLASAGAFNPVAADSYDITITLTGQPWRIQVLALGGQNVRTTIVDDNDSPDARINLLYLGDGGTTLTLDDTRIDYIRGFEVEDNRLTFGTQNTTSVELFDGDDVVTGGSGVLRTVSLGGGDDRFTAGTGDVTFLGMGAGNDTVTVGDAGDVAALLLGEGNDSLTVTGTGRIGSVNGFDGNKTVTLRDEARIEQMNLGNGNATVRIEDEARIYSLKLDRGTFRVTTESGFLESYYSFEGTNILNIGSGGAAQITLSDAVGRQTVNATGFVGNIQASGAGDVSVTLRGGGGQVRTDAGDDRITTTGDVMLAAVRAGDGDDRITIGAGGAQYVDAGDGDNLISITGFPGFQAMVIRARTGDDTVDLSRYDTALTVTLDQGGRLQNIAAPGGDPTLPGFGFVGFIGIDNLIGTARADALTGGAATANRLEGGAGNDTLAGLAGEDVLLGGKGNDRLTGGADADTFRFARADGTDTITDFAVGEDLIAIAGVTALAQIRFTDLGGGGGEGETGGAVRLVANGTTIIVEGVTLAEIRDADNFVF